MLAVAVLVTACTATTSGGTDYVASGRPVSVPSEPLAVVDGDTFAGILVGLRGRPVVVNVWASWCGPCRVEAPLLQDAADEYGDRVAFLGVASRDEPDGAARFIERYGISYPNVFDDSGEVRRALGPQRLSDHLHLRRRGGRPDNRHRRHQRTAARGPTRRSPRMMDRGLFLSVVAVVATVYVTARLARPHTLAPTQVFDVLMGPTMVAALVGRLTAMALTDWRSFTGGARHLGVPGWPRVLAGPRRRTLVLWRGARRDNADPLLRLVDLLPYVLWAMAAFDVTCLLREGCFGPASPIGLVPTGLQGRVLPVGILVAAITALVGTAIRRRWPAQPLTTALLALLYVAGKRSVASIWLPRFGDDLTRQHLQSIAVTAAAVIVIAVVTVRSLSPRTSVDDPSTEPLVNPGLPAFTFVAGLLSITSPCALPLCARPTSPYLSTLPLSSLEARSARRAALRCSLAFVAGFSVVFAALGATASVLGTWMARHLDTLTVVAGAVIVVMGLAGLGLLRLPLLAREFRPGAHGNRGRSRRPVPAGDGLRRRLDAVRSGPSSPRCSAWPHPGDSVIAGISLLVVYSIGLGVPFVALALGYQRLGATFGLLRRNGRWIERLGGLILVLVGISYITGSWEQLFRPLQRWLAGLGWPPI